MQIKLTAVRAFTMTLMVATAVKTAGPIDMLKKLFCAGLIFSIGWLPAYAHKCESDPAEQALWLGNPVDKALEAQLYKLFACLDTKDKDEFKLIDATACNWFAGRALVDVWGFTDFKTANGYLSVSIR